MAENLDGTTLKIKKKKFGILGDSEKDQKKYYDMTRAASRDMNKTGQGEKFRKATKVDKETGQIKLRTKAAKGGSIKKKKSSRKALRGGGCEIR